tara:strand:- start:53 stop:1159 length:1107 start_codon:yes stop_codon:yes gene_type:complete
MKKFVIQVLTFLLPFIFILGILNLILFRTGEFFTPLSKLILSENDYIVGYHHNKNYYPLKWKELTFNERKEIWVLGTSRVMSFRKEMFETSFYNAGGTIITIASYLDFLKNIPKEKYPTILIVGLDQIMFKVSIDHSKTLDQQPTVQFFPKTNYLKDFLYKIIFEYDLPIIFKHLLEKDTKNKIGLAAVLESTGYRKDGSWNFNREVKLSLKTNDDKQKFSKDLFRVRNGGSFFGSSDKVNIESVVELKKLVNYCEEHNIHVVAIINPLPKIINQEIKKYGKQKYIDKILPEVRKRIDNSNFEIWDINQLTNYNMNNDEFIDGVHGLEVSIGKTLLIMLNQNSKLIDFVSKEKLTSDLNGRKNNYFIY